MCLQSKCTLNIVGQWTFDFNSSWDRGSDFQNIQTFDNGDNIENISMDDLFKVDDSNELPRNTDIRMEKYQQQVHYNIHYIDIYMYMHVQITFFISPS